MLYNSAYIGETVIVSVAKENREWGYNPAPDGTKAKIIRFEEMYVSRKHGKPGVYFNKSWPVIQLPDGKELQLSGFHLDHEDPISAKERKKTDNSSKIFVRELPTLPFWEDDIVSHTRSGLDFLCKIHRIDYEENKYEIMREDGVSMQVTADQISLVRRGNYWAKENDPSKLFFASIQEEISFFIGCHEIKEVHNKNNMYTSSLDEGIEQFNSGAADYISGDRMTNCCIYSIPDPSLRERARAWMKQKFWYKFL